MKREITREEHNDGASRGIDFVIDGRSRAHVRQILKSPVDFKPRAPEIGWSAPHQPDADLTEAVGRALIEAARVCRDWEAETMQAAA